MMGEGDFSAAFGPAFEADDDAARDGLPATRSGYEHVNAVVSGDRMRASDVGMVRRARTAFDTPPDLLPFLAAERSVHHYAGSSFDRRLATDESFADHLAYGAPDALEAEIARDVGEPRANIRIAEHWQERDLEFPDFVVEALRQPGQAPADPTALQAAALRRKNVRDWPTARTHYVHPPGALYHGACASFSIRLRAVTPKGPNMRFGAASRVLISQRNA